jgi:hypothetical protein
MNDRHDGMIMGTSMVGVKRIDGYRYYLDGMSDGYLNVN